MTIRAVCTDMMRTVLPIHAIFQIRFSRKPNFADIICCDTSSCDTPEIRQLLITQFQFLSFSKVYYTFLRYKLSVSLF